MKGIFTCLLVALSAPAIAMQAASTDQVFCTGQVVVVGKVKGGTSEDCRHRMASPCNPEHGMRLSVSVSEVLAVKKDWNGEAYLTYDPSFTPRHAMELIGQTLDLHVETGAMPWVTTLHEGVPDSGGYLDTPTDAPLTDADIQRLYGGKSFIFTMQPSNTPDAPHWSGAWPMNSKSWAMNVMRQKAGNDCPTLLSGLDGPFSDTPDRQALISQLKVQFAHVFENDGGLPRLELALADARKLNPELDAGSWRKIAAEVDIEVASIMTAKGTGLDLALRTVFDTLSTPELRRLSGIFEDPIFYKFFTALISPEIESVRESANNDSTALPRAMRSVLEKHGLKVPQ
jgi:hypothetical protein